MLDLQSLSDRLDSALAAETEDGLREWLSERRSKARKATIAHFKSLGFRVLGARDLKAIRCSKYDYLA